MGRVTKTKTRIAKLPKKRTSLRWQPTWRAPLPVRLRVLLLSSCLLIGLAWIGAVQATHIAASKYVPVHSTYAKSMYDVADALSSRPASTLVGTKAMLKVLHPTLGAKRQIFMLDTCPSMNDAVVTQLPKRSIAVLVNINSTPGKHQCTLEQIVSAYGRPNASVTLVGSLVAPRQVLLFYDNGPGLSGPVQPISPPQAPATVVPTTLSTLPAATCAGKTILSFVAHQDDDLLFMNPDHLHEFRGGDCMRTVYLTAGDAGQRSAYWLGREKGAEAAYDTMMGHGSSLWLERYIMVANHEYIKMATPRGNPNITLVFLHLPDGNVPGSGFARTHNQSLAKLGAGSIGTVDTVDGQSHYTKDELTNLLVRLMQFYHPNQIDTQAPLNAGATGAEHSDHMTTGQLTTSARMLYSQNVPLLYYTGYPISLLLQNVSGQDLVDKTKAFYAYAPHDSLACVNPADCATDGPYATWLMREYRYIPGDPLIAAPGPVAPPPAPPDGDTGSTGPGDGGTPSSH